jgi:ketosteroid isomerase-like protein
MSQENIAERFRRGMEAYNRGDYEAALAGFHPDIEWAVDADVAPDAATYRGHEGVKQFWETWGEAIKGMSLEVEECRTVAPDQVLAITRARGTGAGSGAAVASRRFAQLADYRDGQAIRVRLYGDVARALEAAGLSE